MTDTAIEEIVAAPKVKLCLTVSMDQLQQKRPIPFLDLMLMDRAIVDDPEKLDPSNLQLIPYIGLIRKAKRADAMPWDLEILTYVRSTKGNEKRLTDKLSIGFGGHIDRLPTDEETLLDLIVAEGRRELMEELGFDIPYKVMSNYVQMDLLVKQSLIYTNEAPVDTVHLGIPVVIQLDDAPDTFTSPDGECVEIQWMEVGSLSIETIERFESWSKIIVGGLRESVDSFAAQHAEQSNAANMSAPGFEEMLQAIAAAGESGLVSDVVAKDKETPELLLADEDTTHPVTNTVTTVSTD